MAEESRPTKKRIAEYWLGKFISKDFEIIDHYEEGADLVVINRQEPSCWACGRKNKSIENNPDYKKALASRNVMKVWDLPETCFLQKAHIIPKMCSGINKPENYFLLCKKCHEESPDFSDPHYFFAYIHLVRNNAQEILDRRNFELERAIHELAATMNKNILTREKGIQRLNDSLGKIGMHTTTVSLYTKAAAVVEGMDDLHIDSLSSEDILKMEQEYEKFGIYWEPED